MLVLTRRPSESLILTFPDELDLDPLEVTILDNGKIGINALDEVEILRSKLVTESILSACD
jgi:sRNA-binding carbon storage regulator CsrA